jgi:hypothetical protein
VNRSLLLSVAALGAAANVCPAQLTLLGHFTTPFLVGLGVDPITGDVWAYEHFGTAIRHYSPAGVELGAVNCYGIAADDADVEFTDGPLTLNGTNLPDGTLLFIDGEYSGARVFAIDKNTGGFITSLTAAFGVNHVVGGAHHRGRGTIFLVQDAVPPGEIFDNLVAEINPQTGEVLQTWYTNAGAPGFTINYGDIDVASNGDIIIVSSNQPQIAQFTPTGTLVRLWEAPQDVSGYCGIGVSRSSCEWWLGNINGNVWRLGGLAGSSACGCYANCDNSTTAPVLNVLDFNCFLNAFTSGGSYANCDNSTTAPVLNVLDFNCFLNRFGAGCP